MVMDLIAMFATGVGAAACVFAAGHLLRVTAGRRLPRWVLPAAAGAAMIAFSIWNEYTWFARVKAQLPPTVEVVLPVAESAPWRPWSYLWPVTGRFLALDTAPPGPPAPDGLRRAEALVVTRWQPTARVPMVFDCAAGRRADLVEGAALDPAGTLIGGEWIAMPPDDPVLAAACRGG